MNTPVNTPSLDLVSIEAINGSIATVQIIGLDNKFEAIIPDGADVKVGEIYSIAMDYKHLIAGDNIPDEDIDKFDRLQKIGEHAVFFVGAGVHALFKDADAAVITLLGGLRRQISAVEHIQDLYIRFDLADAESRHKTDIAASGSDQRGDLVKQTSDQRHIERHHNAEVVLTKVPGNTADAFADFLKGSADLHHQQIALIMSVPFVE